MLPKPTPTGEVVLLGSTGVGALLLVVADTSDSFGVGLLAIAALAVAVWFAWSSALWQFTTPWLSAVVAAVPTAAFVATVASRLALVILAAGVALGLVRSPARSVRATTLAVVAATGIVIVVRG